MYKIVHSQASKRKNEGVQERAAKDLAQDKIENDSSDMVYAILEKKAKLYDKLSRL